MSVYDIDFSTTTKQLLPPSKRKTRNLAWLGVYDKEVQYLHDLLFKTYADGFTGNKWAAGAYVSGDRVRYIDHSVYEAIVNTNAVPGASADWLLVQNIWVGARERMKYNGSLLTLEYALNKWFDTVFRQPNSANNWKKDPVLNPAGTPDIYIINNTDQLDAFAVGLTADSTSGTVTKKDFNADYGIPASFTYNAKKCCTIYVPLAVFNALAANNTDRENIIRNFADKYIFSGIIYTVATY